MTSPFLLMGTCIRITQDCVLNVIQCPESSAFIERTGGVFVPYQNTCRLARHPVDLIQGCEFVVHDHTTLRPGLPGVKLTCRRLPSFQGTGKSPIGLTFFVENQDLREIQDSCEIFGQGLPSGMNGQSLYRNLHRTGWLPCGGLSPAGEIVYTRWSDRVDAKTLNNLEDACNQLSFVALTQEVMAKLEGHVFPGGRLRYTGPMSVEQVDNSFLFTNLRLHYVGKTLLKSKGEFWSASEDWTQVRGDPYGVKVSFTPEWLQSLLLRGRSGLDLHEGIREGDLSIEILAGAHSVPGDWDPSYLVDGRQVSREKFFSFSGIANDPAWMVRAPNPEDHLHYL